MREQGGGLDPWQRQHRMAGTTVAWSVLSLAVGGWSWRRPERWWRSFGQQHVGWAVVDLIIVGVVEGVQARRRARMPDAYDPAVLTRESRHLHRALMINAGLDVGYCLTGLVLAGRRDPRARGAGVAIMIQGGFLLLHDSHHAYRGRR